jgi:hypothetical protein
LNERSVLSNYRQDPQIVHHLIVQNKEDKWQLQNGLKNVVAEELAWEDDEDHLITLRHPHEPKTGKWLSSLILANAWRLILDVIWFKWDIQHFAIEGWFWKKKLFSHMFERGSISQKLTSFIRGLAVRQSRLPWWFVFPHCACISEFTRR